MVKIENLWNNEKFFESHFIFDGIPFWKIIKNDFLKLCSNRIKEAISEINHSLTGKYLKSVLR